MIRPTPRAVLLFSLLIARSVRRPGERLRRSVEALAKGDLDAQVPHTGYPNETGELARAIEVLRIEARKGKEMEAEVKRVAPQATEAVKWAQPVWERNGPFAFLRSSKKHATFGFWRGAELPDPRGLLEGAGTRMRHLKIALGEKPPIEAITEFVREAVRRNETSGSPSRRR